MYMLKRCFQFNGYLIFKKKKKFNGYLIHTYLYIGATLALVGFVCWPWWKNGDLIENRKMEIILC